MKKITFKGTQKVGKDFIYLILEINKIQAKITINTLENKIILENADNNVEIERIIELIQEYYCIENVEIDNVFTEKPQEISGVVEYAKPFSHVEILLKKIEDTVKDFLEEGVDSKKLVEDLSSTLNEMNRRYDTTLEKLPVQVGDIVDCDFGAHAVGEISGYHVQGLVCNVDGKVIFVIPITTSTALSTKIKSLPIEANIFEKKKYLLLNRGQFLRIERVHSILSNVTTEFLDKVWDILPQTYDFKTAEMLNK